MFALGATLSQLQDGQWRTIAFLSKSFSPTEKHYDVYNRELLSVLTALEEWQHLLLGAREKFEIWNDHKNVSYFRKPQGLTPRQVRWMLTLQEYDFELVHKPGNSMKKVDLLSRRTDYNDGKPLIKEATLLPQAWFRPMAHQGLVSLVKTIKELRSEHELETIHALE